MGAEGKGQQINLDRGEGQILSAYLVDEIFATSAYIEIIFECQYKLLFGADNSYYFTYFNVDWVPLTLSESTGTNNVWHYEITGVPVHTMDYITKPCLNTSDLARAMKLNLTNLSSSLDLPSPAINLFASQIMQFNRLYSLEQALNDNQLGKAIYMYADTKELFSATWKTILNQTATVMEFNPLMEGADKIMYQDEQFANVFNTAQGPETWKQIDFLGKMFGTQFTIDTATPARFLNVYTIKFEKIPQFDTGLPFLCTYSKKNCLEGNAFTHCFTNIKLQ